MSRTPGLSNLEGSANDRERRAPPPGCTWVCWNTAKPGLGDRSHVPRPRGRRRDTRAPPHTHPTKPRSGAPGRQAPKVPASPSPSRARSRPPGVELPRSCRSRRLLVTGTVWAGRALPPGPLSGRYGGAVGVTCPERGADSSGERSSTPSAAMTAAAASRARRAGRRLRSWSRRPEGVRH